MRFWILHRLGHTLQIYFVPHAGQVIFLAGFHKSATKPFTLLSKKGPFWGGRALARRRKEKRQ